MYSMRAPTRSHRLVWPILGIAAAVVPLPLLFADTKLVITWLVFVALGGTYALYRRSVGPEMVVAFLFALVVTSYQQYVSSALYLIVLFTIEYVGYYLLGIRIAGQYPSLLGTGIIHGSLSIHLFYLLAGPLYLLATSYLRVR